MNIPFIHAFEVLVVLLVVGKLFQIRKLYIQSTLAQSTLGRKAKVEPRQRVRQVRVPKPQSKQAYTHRSVQKIIKSGRCDSSRYHLPLPEVSFTDEQEQSGLTKLTNNDFNAASGQHYSDNKAELNSYIEDMFFETTYEFIEEPRASKLSPREPETRDEFITITEENAYLVRELQMLNSQTSFSR